MAWNITETRVEEAEQNQEGECVDLCALTFNRRFDLKAMMPRILRASVLPLPQPSHILRLSEVGN